MGSSSTIVLATQNPKKRAELAALAAGRFQVRSLDDIGLGAMVIHETGRTFEENAQIKADAVRAALPPALAAETLAVLADDSGLIVDALRPPGGLPHDDGLPGVRSARFASDHGAGSGDVANNALLLALLDPVPDALRTARFVAAVCARMISTGALLTARGTVEGHIARDLLGSGGFGYDPLFLPAEAGGRRMAELSSDEKHSISHRGRAMRDLLAQLR